MKNTNLGLLILRLTIGVLMLLHGLAKLGHGVDGIAGMLEAKGIPGFIAYGVFIGEIIAPLALIVGYKTRLAAAVLLVNMLVITFMAHPNDIFALSEHGGWKLELVGFYLFGSLALLFTGGGKYAVCTKSAWD
ncbi:MAG: DoxX family protein [Breznakibacter sp.]